MKAITINKDWEITGDSHNYVLNKLGKGKRKSDDKNGQWKKGDACILRQPHYFPELRQCCEWIINEAAKEDMGSFHIMINAIDTAKIDILHALQEIGRK